MSCVMLQPVQKLCHASCYSQSRNCHASCYSQSRNYIMRHATATLEIMSCYSQFRNYVVRHATASLEIMSCVMLQPVWKLCHASCYSQSRNYVMRHATASLCNRNAHLAHHWFESTFLTYTVKGPFCVIFHSPYSYCPFFIIVFSVPSGPPSIRGFLCT